MSSRRGANIRRESRRPSRRRALLGALALAAGLGAQAAPTMTMDSSDRIVLPPVLREFVSPDGRLRLAVETTDGWRTPQPLATLRRGGGEAGRASALWSQTLKHHHGPRAAVVTDAGHVLLVDEWINVTSRFALVLLDPAGRTVATHDHAAVLAALCAPPAQVRAQARSGTWLSSGPVLTPDQRHAHLQAGGCTLAVDLHDGTLRSSPR